MGYELRRVETPDDWAALHRIRREVLFARERHPGFAYNDAHPDDAAANHIKFLLLLDGVAIGTTRLDLRGERAVVRLVAIATDQQRQGHGSVMEQALENHAYKLGITTLMVNSAPDAVGFYEKRGWQREVWDTEELQGIASNCVQMMKHL
jgi:N-acetylglutamate synthase-like GNAT family acetyltransferase